MAEIKLTDLQFEVLDRMRKEKLNLVWTRYIGYSSVTYSGAWDMELVNKAILKSLIKKGVVNFDTRLSLKSSSYKLTQLGHSYNHK